MRPIRKGGVRVVPIPKTPRNPSSINENTSKTHDPVEVFCRIRPLPNPSIDIRCISLHSSTKLGFLSNTVKNRKAVFYTFSHIFTEHANQKEIFDHIAMPLLRGLVKGKNGLLFSYGVTGSGKTHTMGGDQKNPGIVPRSINTLFNTLGGCQTPKFFIKPDKLNGFEVQSENEALAERLKEIQNKRKNSGKKNSFEDMPSYSNDCFKIEDFNDNLMYTMFITYIEIYNNCAYDLLDDNVSTRLLQQKILREDSRHNVFVHGCVEVEVKTAKEALQLYLLGNQRKRMATTSLNAESSRSHSIFNIRLVISPENTNESTRKSQFVISQLSLVDLAGSERCKRTDTAGARLKEAGSINNSLMSLRACLELLRENQQTGQHKHIPYRENRLTYLFKNYFEGEGKVNMIVCINPSIKDLDETVHVLKFAEMTQEVKVARPGAKVKDKKDEPEEVKIDRLLEEIQEIRAKIRENQTELPRCTQISPESNEIQELIRLLKMRKQNVDLRNALHKLYARYRIRLIELMDIMEKYEKAINDHNEKLPALNLKYKNLKNKLKEVKLQYDKANEEVKKKDKDINVLQEKISEKDFKLRQSELDKQKQKRKLEQTSEKLTHQLDGKLRRQREFYNEKMKDQAEKLELVKDILSDHPTPPKVKRNSRTCSATSTVEQNENVDPTSTTEAAQPGTSEELCTYRAPEPEAELNNEYNHISRRDCPVSNTRYRRSRSAGDRWLQHLPANPVPSGTVFQPKLKTRKSVSKLTDIKDVINPKQSKYILVNQTADEEGGLETELYKGNIIPTAGGGAQVVFEDVETLKQESPLKQTQSATPKPNLRRVHPSVTEERCTQAIGHQVPKKPKK